MVFQTCRVLGHVKHLPQNTDIQKDAAGMSNASAASEVWLADVRPDVSLPWVSETEGECAEF